MPWLILAALGAGLVFLLRGRIGPLTRTLKLPRERTIMAVGLAVLSLLSLRTGRLDVAMGLAIAAVVVASYGRGDRAGTGHGPPPASAGKMGTDEAYRVLGLPAGSSEGEVKAAHRRLMLRAHPDLGGSNYLAAKLNEAKDVLLGR